MIRKIAKNIYAGEAFTSNAKKEYKLSKTTTE